MTTTTKRPVRITRDKRDGWEAVFPDGYSEAIPYGVCLTREAAVREFNARWSQDEWPFVAV